MEVRPRTFARAHEENTGRAAAPWRAATVRLIDRVGPWRVDVVRRRATNGVVGFSGKPFGRCARVMKVTSMNAVILWWVVIT